MSSGLELSALTHEDIEQIVRDIVPVMKEYVDKRIKPVFDGKELGRDIVETINLIPAVGAE
jgi:hypothetical protein